MYIGGYLYSWPFCRIDIKVEIYNCIAGWYTLGGEQTENNDFFQYILVKDGYKYIPRVIDFMGLALGYRFVIDLGAYKDVWFNESLLIDELHPFSPL